MGSRTLAIDRPLGVPVGVADGDGETPIIRPDDVDHLTRFTLYGQNRPLAGVRSAVALGCCY